MPSAVGKDAGGFRPPGDPPHNIIEDDMKRKQPITDAVLLEAMRGRILDEIKRNQQANVINNMIGGGHEGVPAVRGVGAEMARATGGQDEVSPDDFDYMVDIMRENLPADESGKSPGWSKKVHRYRTPKDEAPPRKKRVRSA